MFAQRSSRTETDTHTASFMTAAGGIVWQPTVAPVVNIIPLLAMAAPTRSAKLADEATVWPEEAPDTQIE